MSPPNLFNPYRFATVSNIPFYRFLGYKEVTSPTTVLTMDAITPHDQLLHLSNCATVGGEDGAFQFKPSGATWQTSDYTWRTMDNYAASSTATSQSWMRAGINGTYGGEAGWGVNFLSSAGVLGSTTTEVQQIGQSCLASSGNGSSCNTFNQWGRLDSTSFGGEIYQIRLTQEDTQSFSGNQTVLGFNYDDGDDAGDPYFENIGETVLTVDADKIQVTLEAAKEHIWIVWSTRATGRTSIDLTFDDDTSGNYCEKYSDDGSTSRNSVGQSSIRCENGYEADYKMGYLIIKNDGTTEVKGVMQSEEFTGTDSTTAPHRFESANKWTGTGAISTIEITNGLTGDYAAGSYLKVFGGSPT